MTVEKYAKYMKAIVAHHKKEDAFYDAVSLFGCWMDGDIFDEYETMLVDAIEDSLKDKSGWTSYFLYERHGDLSEVCVWEASGAPIDTSTWEKVYELIQEGSVECDW